MITLETIATTKKGLEAQARELEISGRSKMDKDALTHAIREVLTARVMQEQGQELAQMVTRHMLAGDDVAISTLAHEVYPDTYADPNTFTPGDSSCVGCQAQFNANDTARCPTCHPPVVKATPLTVFGIPRARKFKVKHTDSRYRARR